MGELGVTYALHLQFVGKCVVDLLFAIIEQLLWFRRYKQILVEVGIFQRGLVTLSVNFRWNGRPDKITIPKIALA